jgi:hypothetical protein
MTRWAAILGSICAAAAFAPSAARALTFDVILSDPDQVTVINPAAVETVGDTKVLRTVSVSIKRNLVSGGPPQPGYVSTINEYDCAQQTTRWRSFAAYSRFGEQVLKKTNPDEAWAPIAGNPEAAATARVVCDRSETGSIVAAGSIGQLVSSLMQGWDAEAPLPPLQPVTPVTPPPKAKPKPPAAKPRAKATPAP